MPAVEDFEFIRNRMAEIGKEFAAAIAGKPKVNDKGETIGSCGQCQELAVPCSGACCD